MEHWERSSVLKVLAVVPPEARKLLGRGGVTTSGDRPELSQNGEIVDYSTAQTGTATLISSICVESHTHLSIFVTSLLKGNDFSISITESILL